MNRFHNATSIPCWLLAAGCAAAAPVAASEPPTNQIHWAFQAPQRPKVPQVNDKAWVRNPIDNFVLARLESKNLKPSPQANKVTLLRRLSLDMIGLPYQIIVGPKGLASGTVEVKSRKTGAREALSIDAAIAKFTR